MPPNQPMSIDVFSEGATEKGVLEKLCSRGICPHNLVERGGDGEPAFLNKLRLQLKNWFELQQSTQEPLRILVLRDWDKHTGKTPDDLCKSVLNIVRWHQPKAELVRHADYENVFTCPGLAGLSLALHLAIRFYAADFVKATIDDYVLELALRQTTAGLLLKSRQADGQKQQPPRAWLLTPEALIEKVTREIPDLLQQNQVPPLLEAKEFLRFYATILQLHSSPATFAGKVLQHAQEEEIREVFAPLLAAIQALEGEAE